MKVTVQKQDILTIIQSNRTAHRNIFKEAVEGYRTKALELLEKRIAEVKAGKFFTYVQMTLPEDHTRDYDRVYRDAKASPGIRDRTTGSGLRHVCARRLGMEAPIPHVEQRLQ